MSRPNGRAVTRLILRLENAVIEYERLEDRKHEKLCKPLANKRRKANSHREADPDCTISGVGGEFEVEQLKQRLDCVLGIQLEIDIGEAWDRGLAIE